MNKLTYLLLLVLAVASCKKSSTPPSIVGTWKIANISGSSAVQMTPSSPLITTLYSYSGNILTETDTSKRQVTVNNETWSFKNDGTYMINENFQASTATSPTIIAITGWWDYTSSTLPNSTIILRKDAPGILPMGSGFFIQSVTGSQLVLTVNESNSSTTYKSTFENYILTFNRQ